MRIVVSILLSVLIIVASTGFTVSSHICGGKRIKSALSIGKTDVSCGMETDKEIPCSDEETLKTDCCKNVYQNYEIEDDYTQQLVKINIHQPFIVAILSKWLNFLNTETIQADYFVDCSPPPLIKDIPVLLQVFRL